MTLQSKLNTILDEVQITLNEYNPFQVNIAAIGQMTELPIKYIRLNIGKPSFINDNGYTEDYLFSNWYEEDLYENLCCCRQDNIEVSIHTLYDNKDNLIGQIIFIS